MGNQSGEIEISVVQGDPCKEHSIIVLGIYYHYLLPGVTELLVNVDVEVDVQSYRVNVKGKFGLCSF